MFENLSKTQAITLYTLLDSGIHHAHAAARYGIANGTMDAHDLMILSGATTEMAELQGQMAVEVAYGKSRYRGLLTSMFTVKSEAAQVSRNNSGSYANQIALQTLETKSANGDWK